MLQPEPMITLEVATKFHDQRDILEENLTKRNLGLVLVATVNGPPPSPHQTCCAHAAARDTR